MVVGGWSRSQPCSALCSLIIFWWSGLSGSSKKVLWGTKRKYRCLMTSALLWSAWPVGCEVLCSMLTWDMSFEYFGLSTQTFLECHIIKFMVIRHLTKWGTGTGNAPGSHWASSPVRVLCRVDPHPLWSPSWWQLGEMALVQVQKFIENIS